MRLDRALADRGLARSRTEAQSLIAAGLVVVDGAPAAKASADVLDSSTIEVIGTVCPYVSRGGLKLAAALDEFGIDVEGRECLDVGASTGGFTDCLLQRGAKHVTAIDVGHGQMVPTLAADPRVTMREGVNARALTPDDFDRAFDLVVADLSFISLTLVIPAISNLAKPGGEFVLLVKPQFEVGPSGLSKGGIVRDVKLRQEALDTVAGCAEKSGLVVEGWRNSPIAGGDGNEEFLLWAKRESVMVE
jgi:23S rRNA (cytidine1920-2'-O)/16S rRNA (cytidine1409-2'-O)-methyltransferase